MPLGVGPFDEGGLGLILESGRQHEAEGCVVGKEPLLLDPLHNMVRERVGVDVEHDLGDGVRTSLNLQVGLHDNRDDHVEKHEVVQHDERDEVEDHHSRLDKAAGRESGQEVVKLVVAVHHLEGGEGGAIEDGPLLEVGADQQAADQGIEKEEEEEDEHEGAELQVWTW